MFFSDLSGSYKITRRLPFTLLEKVYRRLFMKYDAVVYIVGNAFKNYRYMGKYQTAWIRNMSKISSNTYLLSTNFGPFDNVFWVKDCRKVFAKMKDVCFRDIQSYKLFCHSKNVRYAPDAVFTYKVKEKCDETKNALLISLIDCKFFSRPPEIKDCTDQYEKRLLDIIEYFLRKKYNIYILNFNMEQDIAASKRVFQRCNYNSNVQIINYNGDFSIIDKVYKKSKFVIGTRLHSIILSWIYNIPVIPIAYDEKIINILISYKFNGRYYRINELDDISGEDVCEAFKDYSFRETHIDNLRKMAEAQFLKLDLFLK